MTRITILNILHRIIRCIGKILSYIISSTDRKFFDNDTLTVAKECCNRIACCRILNTVLVINVSRTVVPIDNSSVRGGQFDNYLKLLVCIGTVACYYFINL